VLRVCQGEYRTNQVLVRELGQQVAELSQEDMDELGQLSALHGAVAEAVFVHHMLGRPALPTKDGLLQWGPGEAVGPLRARTGADYQKTAPAHAGFFAILACRHSRAEPR